MDWKQTDTGLVAHSHNGHWTIKKDCARGLSVSLRRHSWKDGAPSVHIASTPWLHEAKQIAEREDGEIARSL